MLGGIAAFFGKKESFKIADTKKKSYIFSALDITAYFIYYKDYRIYQSYVIGIVNG